MLVGNIVSGACTGARGFATWFPQVGSNLVLGTSAGCGTNPIQNPGAVGTTAVFDATGHTVPGSIAVDAIALGTPGVSMIDIDGQPRPRGPRLDVGADEH
jgi:hypothetical protein